MLCVPELPLPISSLTCPAAEVSFQEPMEPYIAGKNDIVKYRLIKRYLQFNGLSMLAVITGDIVSSRTRPKSIWLPQLKGVLRQYGAESSHWMVYRGDSFQIALNASLALKAALHIKAGIRQKPGLDVRMGIGIGKQVLKTGKITEATGIAFVRSGHCFEGLKKQNLGILSEVAAFDDCMNVMISLALLTMNNWSEAVSKVISTCIEYPELNQLEISRRLKKSQSTISEALKRGGYDEVRQMEGYYQQQIPKLA